jgi:hypothetical protein
VRRVLEHSRRARSIRWGRLTVVDEGMALLGSQLLRHDRGIRRSRRFCLGCFVRGRRRWTEKTSSRRSPRRRGQGRLGFGGGVDTRGVLAPEQPSAGDSRRRSIGTRMFLGARRGAAGAVRIGGGRRSASGCSDWER